MGNNVFANGREVSCKAADGKSICAFPDVCLTPPPPPAGPIPIPYPNTAFAKDATKGSKKVKISKKEVMLKRKSYFKKSMGDEAATRMQGMGVITHTISGKVYFNSWSMDVKFEGQNVVRHLDLTTHNHRSDPGQTPPWPYLDTMAFSGDVENPCKDHVQGVKDNCPPPKKSLARSNDFHAEKLVAGKATPGPQDNTSPECCDARKCMLVPYSPTKRCTKCGKTGHHPIPVADLSTKRMPHPVSGKLKARGDPLFPDYKHSKAPCICADGADHNNREGPTEKLMQHGRIGRGYVVKRDKMLGDRENFSYNEVNSLAAEAVSEETGCNKECIEHQLDAAHKEMNVDFDKKVLRKGEKRVPVLEKKPAPVSPSC